jgi:hypothetical protein
MTTCELLPRELTARERPPGERKAAPDPRLRHHRLGRLVALAGAGVLFADAWFDVCTSPAGLSRWLAVGEALGLELPLAAAAIWLAITLTRKANPR